MYLFKMLIFFVLYSGLQVHAQFPPLEITGSGDGLNENSSYSRLPLLDDNGDISTSVTSIDIMNNLGETGDNFTNTTVLSMDTSIEDSTEKVPVNDTFTDIIVILNSTTTIPTTDLPITDLQTTDISVDSTTTSLLTMTITETTPFEEITTEEDDFTTATAQTATTAKTTKKPIKTDSATEIVEGDYKPKPMDTTAKSPPTLAPVPTIPMPEDAGKRCLFMDTGLNCEEEILCYGEGEIDCDEVEEMDADELDSDDEIPSSFDESDYEGKTSDMFPIRRIGSNSMRIDLFKMFPLTPTMNNITSEKTQQNKTTTSIQTFNFTTLANEELLDAESAEVNYTVKDDDVLDSEATEVWTTDSTNSPKTDENEELSHSTANSANIDFSEDKLLGNNEILIPNFPNSSEIQSPNDNETIIYMEFANNGTPLEVTASDVDLTTSYILETILPENGTGKEDKEHSVITRTRRDKSANNSNGNYISKYKVSELESSKKKLKVKLCKLSGNLVCFPSPTKLSCSGKTVCQVPPQAIETVEKPATQKGLENWTIAVIAICAITASFTIALLIYLVFTSYKKLKVQPQNNGVTTLNYVNSTQP